MFTEDQSATVAFLADPETHGLDRPVRTMETHISRIFLTGGRVYKLKRAVKLPYVDFSTPEIRLNACEREVEFNSPGAPGLYCGVRRITRAPDGTLAFDSAGDLVDAVVEMVEFAQEQLFDRMADRGELDASLMADVAEMIADYHGRAPAVHTGSGSANVAGVLTINEAGFATSHLFEPGAVARLNAAFRAGLALHADLLDRREVAGHVRRCHGDLHLRNICRIGDRPCLFDCIEFNDQIAICDTLYDLAFLLMDLWHRGMPELANRVANRYLDRTGDDDGFVLLTYFMAMRSAVRAHVTATQIEEGSPNAALAAEARSYFALAESLLSPAHSRAIVIGGLSGSGKSTIADLLAPELAPPPGARIIESDRLRKRHFGVTPETPLPPEAYRPEVSVAIYRQMIERLLLIAGAGGSVIVDAVYDRPETRIAIAESASAAGLAPLLVWLDADPERLRDRVRARARKDTASDADTAILDRQLDHDPGTIDWLRIDAARPVAEIVEELRNRLHAPKA